MPFDGSTTRNAFGGVRYSAAEDADIIEGRRLGMSFDAIRKLIGTGRDAASIASRFNKLEAQALQRQEAARAAAQTKDRTCLRCRRSFPSLHAGNRRCAACTVAVADYNCAEVTVHGHNVH